MENRLTHVRRHNGGESKIHLNKVARQLPHDAIAHKNGEMATSNLSALATSPGMLAFKRSDQKIASSCSECFRVSGRFASGHLCRTITMSRDNGQCCPASCGRVGAR